MGRIVTMSDRFGILRPVFLFVCIFVLWSVYRYGTALPEWADEFVAKPVLQLLPVFIIVWFLEKRGVGSLGVSRQRLGKHAAIGIVVGIFLVVESVVLRIVAGRTVSINTNGELLLGGAVSIATGFLEELVYRGYFMNRFLEFWENEYVANVISALFFALIHVPLLLFTLHYAFWRGFIYILQIFVLGLIFGYEFSKTRAITASAVSHAMWNFSSILLPPL